ncbi:DUF2793 domain-containing protein [Salipiger aestuarii]|uniref:DUF2793 domain-containing protein n=1 Tax=Salipiger aestuarii TaxID=568098 RepID=UPI00123A20D6|nr:DUF2793 domain-containing protein [Salipiger aestuarii]KAA8610013.1 hypothetical protein AL037_14245 [Salipiger aestuarii]
MPDTSARLGLPYLMPAQAQKHVTHNEALTRLDLLTQLVLEARGAETPPASPADGEIHALGAAPVDAWAGQAGMLAQWIAPAWVFSAPAEGWRAWDKAGAALCIYQGGDWQALDAAALQNLDGLGIGATSDTVNRLSVAAEATLLSHAGAGHQLKLNKAAAGDTASLLYQSNWTGHAEMGLAGDTDFRIKVSPDGSSWTDALTIAAATGHITGAAVQASATDTTAGRLMRADYGYGPGNLLGTVSQSGGTPTGAVIESGSNANGRYVRYADGTQVCTRTATSSASADASWTFPAAFASATDLAVTITGRAASGVAIGTARVPGTASTGWAAYNTSGSRVAVSCSLVAIGRWV